MAKLVHGCAPQAHILQSRLEWRPPWCHMDTPKVKGGPRSVKCVLEPSQGSRSSRAVAKPKGLGAGEGGDKGAWR
jgi:hypothetical protein